MLKQFGSLTKKEVVWEFYAYYESFHLDDHALFTSIVKGQTLELSLVVIRNLYEQLEIIDHGFSHKGMGALLKTRMSDFFVGPKRPKLSAKVHRLPMNSMLPFY